MSGAIQGTAFSRQLKRWRRQRGLSQLELAIRADVSQRHVSFMETGRARPRREMVHKVAEALEIPLRERNKLLEAAGLAAHYPELPLSGAEIAPFRKAVRHMLDTHEPYPAYVIDRYWDVIDANQAGKRMFLIGGGEIKSSVDAFLGPGPLRELIDNFASVAWAFLRRIRSDVANAGQDARLGDLLERAESYLKDVPEPPEPGSDLVVRPRLKIGGKLIETVSMVARFGHAREITLDELRVELVYPGDDAAAEFFVASAKAASSTALVNR
jgi:transcriptional regulator with XRE-family HTH domain